MQERTSRRQSTRLGERLGNFDWALTDEPVNVSVLPDETIFSGPASKTVEFHSQLGRAMVWWTSKPSGAFQIVQRRQSGWVNWCTNGENECPELPVGVAIKTAYGPFKNNWRTVADQLETPPVVSTHEYPASDIADCG